MNRLTASQQLTDESPFPFGKWKGTPMRNVPATYLDWLRGQDWIGDWPAVVDYLERSAKAIDWELKREGKLD